MSFVFRKSVDVLCFLFSVDVLCFHRRVVRPITNKTKQYDARYDANTESERPGTELKLLLAFILSS